jgi:FlaG/FlaF family flagellin (archaellin)
VIGLLLMVAVVVVLGAVIASFAFGMAADVTRTLAIAISAHQNGDDILLTYMDGRDVPSLARLVVTGEEADGTAISDSFPNTPPAVGDTLPLTGAGNPGGDHVVVVAELVDGSRQVVLDVVV